MKGGCHCCEQGLNCPRDLRISESCTVLLRVDLGEMAVSWARTAVPAESKKGLTTVLDMDVVA